VTDQPEPQAPPTDQAPPSDRTPADPGLPQSEAQHAAVKAGDTVRVRANVSIFNLAAFEEADIGRTDEVDACIANGLLTEL
jgi:hypothetical protein